MAQTVKNLPAMQEIQVRPLGQEVPLEKGMAIHSSILAGKIPWTEEPGRLYALGSQRVRLDRVTFTFSRSHSQLQKKLFHALSQTSHSSSASIKLRPIGEANQE